MQFNDLWTPKRLALALTFINLLALMGASLSPTPRMPFVGGGFLAAMAKLLLPVAVGATWVFYSYVVRRRDRDSRPFSITWKGYLATLLLVDCVLLSSPWSHLLSASIIVYLIRSAWLAAHRDQDEPDSWGAIWRELGAIEWRHVFARPLWGAPENGPDRPQPKKPTR